MSPSDATAHTRNAQQGTRVTDVRLANQVRALVVGGAETTAPRAARRRREEEESPRTPIMQHQGTAQRQARGDEAGTKVADGKDRIFLRALDAGKPEAYDNWRRSAQAAVACRAGVEPVAMEYLAEIDNPRRTDAELTAIAKQVPALRVIDMHLYTAILDCIDGHRRDTVLNRIHASVGFGEGGLALRCLDRIFQRSSVKQRAAATAELLHLAPSGPGAMAIDDFLARFRTLLSRTGTDVGPAAQADILQRAAAGHPVLGAVAAAWKHGDGEDAGLLLERLEAAAAEGLYAGKAGGHVRAWAALSATPEPEVERRQQLDTAMAATERTATVGGVGGPECWSCGMRGHRQFECPKGKKTENGKSKGKGKGQDKGQSGNEALSARMDRLERMLEHISTQLSAKNA